MESIALVGWPFDLGRHNHGMGAGAERLLSARLLAAVRSGAPEVIVSRIDPVDEDAPEMARIIELDRRLADTVRGCVSGGSFPLVLAGNCISCLGTVAGSTGSEPLGVVWLDAHADFDTPEDNLSGFSDVMGLSVLTGQAWQALGATIPGLRPIPEHHVVLAGTRDLADYQRERLAGSQIAVVPGAIEPAAFIAALADLRDRVARVYLHVDLDVLSTSVGRANAYAAPGGPELSAVLARVRETCDRFDIAAAAITAYDPTCDRNGRILRAARAIAGEVASGAAQGPGSGRARFTR